MTSELINERASFCELYPTISEGNFYGFPTLLIRFFGSNYDDKNDNRKYSFDINSGNKKVMISVPELLNKISSGDNLSFKTWYFCGGEVLLQQKFLVSLIEEAVEKFERKHIIDLETNGTIVLEDRLASFLDGLVVKLKMSNSIPKQSNLFQRINPTLCKDLKEMFKDKKIQFVFEVKTIEDLNEVGAIQTMIGLENKEIYLQPVYRDFISWRNSFSVCYSACLRMGYNLKMNNAGLVYGFKPIFNS